MKNPIGKIRFLIPAIITVASCTRDPSIIADYKIYDLDGSNQEIIGNKGMTAVSDVTAYSIYQNQIAFETGSIENKNISVFNKNGIQTRCNYGVIETENGMIIYPQKGNSLYKAIRKNIQMHGKSIVNRSCT